MEFVRLVAYDVLLIGGALFVICLFFFMLFVCVACVKWIRILLTIQGLVEDWTHMLRMPLMLIELFINKTNKKSRK